MNFPTLQTRQRQQHTVTPRLQHAVRLLQLSSLDFAQEVQDAMGRNPFLEVEDSPPDAGRVELGTVNGDGEPRGIDLEATAPIADAPYDRENWQQSSSSDSMIAHASAWSRCSSGRTLICPCRC